MHTSFIYTHARVHLGYITVVLGGLVFIVLAIGPKVRGFKPDRGRYIFKGDSTTFSEEK
jgi:hypothetical protein